MLVTALVQINNYLNLAVNACYLHKMELNFKTQRSQKPLQNLEFRPPACHSTPHDINGAILFLTKEHHQIKIILGLT